MGGDKQQAEQQSRIEFADLPVDWDNEIWTFTCLHLIVIAVDYEQRTDEGTTINETRELNNAKPNRS